ncbi:PilW family protein [Lysobacter humi (ex Lee et al. 2017)]
MIALVLGLVVVGAAGGVFLANRRVYAASETLNRVQENGRISFELLARDLREAGGNPCGSADVVNMLKRSATDWTEGLFTTGVRGYAASGTYLSDYVDIALMGSAGTGGGKSYKIKEYDNPAAVMELEDDPEGLVDGDIVMACNSEKGVIFQITGTPADKKVQFHKNGGTPGNCESNLQGQPVGPNCAGSAGGTSNNLCFKASGGGDLNLSQCGGYASENSKKSWYSPILVKAGAVRWYVADNGRGSRSLYRAPLNASGWSAGAGEEIAEGVTALQLRYRLSTDPAAGFREAAAIPAAQWPNVNAVRVAVTTTGVAGSMTSKDVAVISDSNDADKDAALQRTFTYVVSLRNREVL